MPRTQQPRDPVRLFGKRVVLIGALALCVGVSDAAYHAYGKQRESLGKRTVAERELAELQAREADLRAEIAHFNTREGMEAELRTQFELGKEGEGVVVFVEQRIAEGKSIPVEAPPAPWWGSLFPFLPGRTQ